MDIRNDDVDIQKLISQGEERVKQIETLGKSIKELQGQYRDWLLFWANVGNNALDNQDPQKVRDVLKNLVESFYRTMQEINEKDENEANPVLQYESNVLQSQGKGDLDSNSSHSR